MMTNDEENAILMLLTPSNSTNPLFWGKDLRFVLNGKELNQAKLDFPTEFDFFNLWCGKNPIEAKEYYLH